MLKTLGIGVLIYAIVVGGLAACQRQFIYYPDPTRPDPTGVPEAFEPVGYSTVDGLELEGWYAQPSHDDAPVIVYFQGNAGHAGHRLEPLMAYVEEGWGVLVAGYRGYGGNPGRPDEDGLMADARAAVDHLVESGVAPDRQIYYGESLGTGLAVALAAEDRDQQPAAVVLQAPYTSLAAVGQRSFPFAPVGLLLRDRFDSRSRIGQVTAPTLVIHGSEDEIIPVGMGREMADAAGGPSRFVNKEGLRHNDLFMVPLHEDIFAFYADMVS